jgi:hypothetical protein
MGATRFGQLLGRFVPLSEQDVAEVLDAQAVSGRRFGEIALSWGLCRPLHIWQAWSAQLAHDSQRVDLNQLGIDTQALAQVPASIARAFGVLPVRAFDNVLILATSPCHRPREPQLRKLLPQELQFVLCEPEQLSRAIDTYYPESPIAGPSHEPEAAVGVA